MARILIIAPHADDDVLGVGGTIAKRASEGHDITIAIMTGHGCEPHPLWGKETWDVVRKEAKDAHKILGVAETVFCELPAVLLPDQPLYKNNQVVAEVIERTQPEILYVPFLFDMHRDHRELVYACNVAWRPVSKIGKRIREIYMYETLSETHWNIQPQEPGFTPNVWVDITDFLDSKINALRCFHSQMQPFPATRSIEAVKALATWRGTTVGFHAAEAFILVRMLN